MNKRIHHPLLWVLSALLLASCASTKTELFSSLHPEGWTTCLKETPAGQNGNTFQLDNGIIHISGQPYGYIRTTAKYSRFRLHAEWRWTAAPADGGIFVFLQDGDKVWPSALQCQMRPLDLGFLMGGLALQGVESNNGFYKKPSINNRKVEKPTGEWNTTDIDCKNGHVKVFINGILVNEADCEKTVGYIGLQSEGGPIDFRHVTVKGAAE